MKRDSPASTGIGHAVAVGDKLLTALSVPGQLRSPSVGAVAEISPDHIGPVMLEPNKAHNRRTARAASFYTVLRTSNWHCNISDPFRVTCHRFQHWVLPIEPFQRHAKLRPRRWEGYKTSTHTLHRYSRKRRQLLAQGHAVIPFFVLLECRSRTRTSGTLK